MRFCGSDFFENGVGDGTRTRDILSHSQTLHQLSYTHHKTVSYNITSDRAVFKRKTPKNAKKHVSDDRFFLVRRKEGSLVFFPDVVRKCV